MRGETWARARGPGGGTGLGGIHLCEQVTPKSPNHGRVWVGRDLTDHPVLIAATGRDILHQPGVLRAPSNLTWDVPRDGASTTALGNLGQGLTTLTGKNFFLISHLNVPSLSLKPSPLVPSPHALVPAPLQLSCRPP